MANAQCTWKFIQKIHFKLKNLREIRSWQLGKLKIGWHSSNTTRFVKRYFALELTILTFQFGEKPRSRSYQLVNDCKVYTHRWRPFQCALLCSHSIHLKIPHNKSTRSKRERTHSASTFYQEVVAPQMALNEKIKGQKRMCRFFRFCFHSENEKTETLFQMHNCCSQNHISDMCSVLSHCPLHKWLDDGTERVQWRSIKC